MERACLTARSAMDKAVRSLKAYGDEAHREDTSRRNFDKSRRQFERGQTPGGRTFGYRNVTVFAGLDAHGRPLKSGVVREIDLVEAAVVVRIYEWYDAGLGLKAIAQRLTAEGAAKPKPMQRKDGLIFPGWSPSSVRAILRRETYRGQLIWGTTKKRDSWGQKYAKAPRTPEADWLRRTDEALRIVPEDLWLRVAARLAETERRATRWGRPPKHAAPHLLAGLSRCGLCGGALYVETSARKRGRVAEYVCSTRRKNGGCANALRIAASEMEAAVRDEMEAHVLTPAGVEAVIALSERADGHTRRATLTRERETLTRQIARVTDVIATSEGDSRGLVAKLRDLETRRAAVDRDLVACRAIPRLPHATMSDHFAELRRFLHGTPTQARAVLQRVIVGRITFTPDGGGYSFSAATRYDGVFAGVAAPPPAWIAEGNEGWTHLTPEYLRDLDESILAFDPDYGQMLARVYAAIAPPTDGYVKVVASPRGMAASWIPVEGVSDYLRAA